MAGKFAIDVKRFCEKAKANIDVALRKVIFDLSANIVLMSPVGDDTTWQHKGPKGYVGGRFRANWQFGNHSINKNTTEEKDASGGDTIARIQAEASTVRAGGVVYLTNSLPYALRLEHGWSKQAPAGMVELSVRNYAHVVNDAVKTL